MGSPELEASWQLDCLADRMEDMFVPHVRGRSYMWTGVRGKICTCISIYISNYPVFSQVCKYLCEYVGMYFALYILVQAQEVRSCSTISSQQA